MTDVASVPPRRINAAYIRHAPLALTILCGFVGGGILSEIVQSMLPVSLNALGGPQSDAKRRTSLTIELRAISPFAGLSTKRSTSRTSWPIFWVAGSLSSRLAGSKRAQRDIPITNESPWTAASHDICNGSYAARLLATQQHLSKVVLALGNHCGRLRHGDILSFGVRWHCGVDRRHDTEPPLRRCFWRF